jgi:hypothetical protein
MPVIHEAELLAKLEALRTKLEVAFGPDTALGPYNPQLPSTGHCAAVAAIVESQLGGTFASATVGGISHWFNRFALEGGVVDVDITGDQFGHERIRIANKGTLFQGTRERKMTELNEETRKRSRLLAERAGLSGDPIKDAA